MSVKTGEQASLIQRVFHPIAFICFIGAIIFLMLWQVRIAFVLASMFGVILIVERLVESKGNLPQDLRIATIADLVALVTVALAFVSILWGSYGAMAVFSSVSLSGILVSFMRKPL